MESNWTITRSLSVRFLLEAHPRTARDDPASPTELLGPEALRDSQTPNEASNDLVVQLLDDVCFGRRQFPGVEQPAQHLPLGELHGGHCGREVYASAGLVQRSSRQSPITARTLARSPVRISIARPSPISAPSALSKSSAFDVDAIGLVTAAPFLGVATRLAACFVTLFFAAS